MITFDHFFVYSPIKQQWKKIIHHVPFSAGSQVVGPVIRFIGNISPVVSFFRFDQIERSPNLLHISHIFIIFIILDSLKIVSHEFPKFWMLRNHHFGQLRSRWQAGTRPHRSGRFMLRRNDLHSIYENDFEQMILHFFKLGEPFSPPVVLPFKVV